MLSLKWMKAAQTQLTLTTLWVAVQNEFVFPYVVHWRMQQAGCGQVHWWPGWRSTGWGTQPWAEAWGDHPGRRRPSPGPEVNFSAVCDVVGVQPLPILMPLPFLYTFFPRPCQCWGWVGAAVKWAVQSQADVAVQTSLLLQVSPREGLLEVWRPEKELQDFSPPCSWHLQSEFWFLWVP